MTLGAREVVDREEAGRHQGVRGAALPGNERQQGDDAGNQRRGDAGIGPSAVPRFDEGIHGAGQPDGRQGGPGNVEAGMASGP
ncbi:hypothetical protein ACTXG5_02825 [Mycobacterium sp. Dal123C01]|uniref:hypothetical protein n=1 Tax=Mycobacterium sp. Dal123C01 TaxID=3457577 RepID=UPI00403ED521